MQHDDRSAVVVVDYDEQWPDDFDKLASEIRDVVNGAALDVIHIGSTAVPGLPAKPVIDVALLVDDSSDESLYLEPLLQAGYWLAVREPDWYEHRMFQRERPLVNLHVYSADCPEVGRVLRFRDWLRTHDEDRDRYGAAKRDLARAQWDHVQDYADAKSDVIAEILQRALT